MQQQTTKICVQAGCEHSPFLGLQPSQQDPGVDQHPNHQLLDWHTIIHTAQKCTTDQRLFLHLQDVQDRIQKIKETLDLVKAIHIQKLSHSRFKIQLSGEQAQTLDIVMDPKRRHELTGNRLHDLLAATKVRAIPQEVGVHIDQERLLGILDTLQRDLDDYKHSNKVLGQECFDKGWEKWNKSLPLQAIEYYSRALELNPEHCEAYFQRGFVYHSQNLDTLAQTDYNNCLHICSQHSSSLTNRGYIQSQRGNKIKALEWYSKALEANPANPIGYNNRGYIHFALYRYTDALSDVNKSIQLQASKEAFKLRAEIMFKLGRRKEGCKDLQMADKL